MFSRYSVKKPYTVIVGIILVIVLGVISFQHMTTDLLPSMNLPYVVVYTPYVGATPEQVEDDLTRPMEAAFATLNDVKKITSSSRDNVSVVIMQFNDGANMDTALIEISSRLDQLRSDWNDDVGAPVAMKLNPDMLPVAILSVTRDDMDILALSDYVEDELVPAFEALNGVASAEASGVIEQRIDVTIEQSRIDVLNAAILKDVDAELADVMHSSRATHLAGVPYMYEMLERFRFFERDFPALRGLLVSGGALAPALRRKFAESAKARGISFSEGYGQTETTGVMSTIRTDLMPERIGSIGKAGEGGRFRVDDGELVYEGPIVAMGYAVCAEDLLKGDEWKGVRRTGDLATIDADGYVTLTGRASRFLKIFGNRVSLDEVENLVKDGFSGAGCAATGADNDLHVFVAHASAADVGNFLVGKLHFNATVMKVHALDSIPLNANGKTDYPKLKGMCR